MVMPYYIKRRADVNIVDEPENKSPQDGMSMSDAFPEGEERMTETTETSFGVPRRMEGQLGNSLGELSMDDISPPDSEWGRMNDAYHDDNTSEDTDIHAGLEDDGAYDTGHGPQSHYENADHTYDIVTHANMAIGRGSDPYTMGRVYGYEDLIEQHRKEIDINWHTAGGTPTGRHYLWVRSVMPVSALVAESQRWYDENRRNRWDSSDKSRVAALAECILDKAVMTPLLVSPIGEANGGVWEGYHRLRAYDMLGIEEAPVLIKIGPYDSQWRRKVGKKKDEHPWFCVDLDGTILTEDKHFKGKGRPNLGKPKDGAVEALRTLHELGRVSIWTARQYFEKGTDWKKDLAKHLKEHDIVFDDIYVGKKPPADAFIDDKGIEFEDNWGEIEKRLKKEFGKEAMKPYGGPKPPMMKYQPILLTPDEFKALRTAGKLSEAGLYEVDKKQVYWVDVGEDRNHPLWRRPYIMR